MPDRITMPKSKEKEADFLSRLYYAPGGYQGARALQAKAAEAGRKIDLENVRDWLKRQELAQLHSHKQPTERRKTHFTETKLNKLHQADIMHMPTDQGFRYILALVDAGTRYKAARALRTKAAKEVAAALADIYGGSGPLRPPVRIMVDAGKEFLGETTKMLEAKGVHIRRAEPGHHRSQAFVESFNRRLAERLFRYEQAKEILTGELCREWVDVLPKFVDAMNHEKTRLIGVTPAAAAKRGEAAARHPKHDPDEHRPPLIPLEAWVRVRVPSDRNEGGKRRATDYVWSREVYSIAKRREWPDGSQPPLYFLEGRRHGVTSDDLLAVPQPHEPPRGILSAPVHRGRRAARGRSGP